MPNQSDGLDERVSRKLDQFLANAGLRQPSASATPEADPPAGTSPNPGDVAGANPITASWGISFDSESSESSETSETSEMSETSENHEAVMMADTLALVDPDPTNWSGILAAAQPAINALLHPDAPVSS